MCYNIGQTLLSFEWCFTVCGLQLRCLSAKRGQVQIPGNGSSAHTHTYKEDAHMQYRKPTKDRVYRGKVEVAVLFFLNDEKKTTTYNSSLIVFIRPIENEPNVPISGRQ